MISLIIRVIRLLILILAPLFKNPHENLGYFKRYFDNFYHFLSPCLPPGLKLYFLNKYDKRMEIIPIDGIITPPINDVFDKLSIVYSLYCCSSVQLLYIKLTLSNRGYIVS